jgi:glycosyltransferase involved in cell wall biosynthesis
MKNFLKVLYAALFLPAILLAIFTVPLRILRKVTVSKEVRSLWAGSPIITMALKAKSERLLGINSKSLVYSTFYITSAFDYNLSRWYSIPALGKLLPFVVFLWACVFTDRLHFYCNRGLIPSIKPFAFNFPELYVYRLLKIQVLFWTYGADVRSRDTTKLSGEPNCCTECMLIGKACCCDEKSRMIKIERLKKYSDAIFSMGDMKEYTPGSHNDLFFWPIDLKGPDAGKYEPVYPQTDKDKPLRIVHASNHKMFKGTHFLVEAVDNLKAQGILIELILVEKVPNKEALDIYRSADIIFDQCLIGFHGYFALEGMAMGKPVMCFLRKPEEYLLHPEECPIINIHITTLENDLRRFFEDREELRNIGVRGRKYIEKYFTIEAFALRLKKAYDDLGVSA